MQQIQYPTRELKAAGGQVMHPEVHGCNGLARTAGESMMARG